MCPLPSPRGVPARPQAAAGRAELWAEAQGVPRRGMGAGLGAHCPRPSQAPPAELPSTHPAPLGCPPSPPAGVRALGGWCSVTKGGAAYRRRSVPVCGHTFSPPAQSPERQAPGPGVASPPGPHSLLSRITPSSSQTQWSEPLSSPRASSPPWRQAQPSWTRHRRGSPAHSPPQATHTPPGALQLLIWPLGSKI